MWLLPFQANADPSVISCMHNLSRRIAIAMQHEERRCQYLTREAKLMLAVQDEITTMAESETHTSHVSTFYLIVIRIMMVYYYTIFSSLDVRVYFLYLFFLPSADGSPQSPFRQILPKCKLARDLKEAYDRCVVFL